MSKSWLHPTRPNVPQPPYNLAPEEPEPTRVLRRRGSQGPQSVPMQRQPPQMPVPPLPVLSPPNPHAMAYHAQMASRARTAGPAPEQAADAAEPSSRPMTAEQRAAYIREVDARNAASQAQQTDAVSPPPAAAGLRPLRLASNPARNSAAPALPSQVLAEAAQALDEPMARLLTPPADDDADDDNDEVSEYMAGRYDGADDAAAVDKAGESQNAEIFPSTPAPASPEPEAADDPDEADAAMANNAYGRQSVLVSPVQSVTGTDQGPLLTLGADQPAAALGAAAGASPYRAVIEVYSAGAVVARITLPYPPFAQPG